ncbi:MAG: helix-turn-helix transcriptional regulator [Thermoleophilia bacterium]|nr:helix-turn-helix transcriptional regulator [Thermoleophilia bacterium]
MTNADLCARAGVCPATVSRYLNGSRCSTSIDDRGARTIEKLAAVFGLKPEFFLEYRIWRVCEIARRHPHLIDQVYDILVEAATL